MGDGEKASLRLQFNPKIRLEFHGSTITTDAGLLAFREFDDAFGLTEIAEDYLQESRTGRNILHHLVPLLRQSIYSRLAGYDDTNVRFGGTTIQYHVRRSARRRKTVDITMDGAGVQVAVPQDTPDEDVRDIVRRRAPWILAHAPETLLEALPKGFVSGETLPYLGRNVRMVVSVGDVRAPEVRFDHWRLRITVPRDLPGVSRPERIGKAVVSWYRRRAEARLAKIVDRWWLRFGGGEPYRLLIRDQRQRWGSCAPDGTLRFNWRLAMLKPDLAEYVVVHELAHLRVRNHSPEFWDLLSLVMPDAQERRRRLREVGKALPL